jgi:short-subunit dehydrogenase
MGGIDIRGEHILVTGASSGIGREIALKLGRRGAKLAVAARNEDLLEDLSDTVAQRGVRPLVLPTDLADPSAAAGLARRAIEALGHVDVLVNNAGVGVGGSQLAVADTEAAREVFQVNYWSPLALQHELVPAMISRSHGVVVNVTSLATLSPWPALGHYSSTKAALAVATETLRLELTHSPVNVLEVIPGPVETAIQAESRLLPGFRAAMRRTPQGDPVVLARLVADALERGRARVVYPRRLGLVYELPGLMRVILPRLVARYVSADDIASGVGSRVVRAGSQGDEVARRARAEWQVRSASKA